MNQINIDYFDTIKKYKRVKTIVKRRHDNEEYDKHHPLYKTVITEKSIVESGIVRKSNYLDVYYINDPEGKQLFTYSQSHGRLDKNPDAKLKGFIEKFYNDFKIKENITTNQKERESRVH